MKTRRIAIIGGGMTGLSLAYFLGKQGFYVSIIEKGSTLSGLLAFTHVPPKGVNAAAVPIERFYHHFFTNDHHLLAMLDELGLEDHILWKESANAVYCDGKLFPFSTKTDFLRLPFLGAQAKVRSAIAALALRFQQPEHLAPALTAETYLRKLFGEEGWKKLWRPLLVNKFGEDDSHFISAQWIAKRIQIRSGSERHGREVLGYLDGSYRVLAEGLRAAIQKQGGSIILDCEVRSLPCTSEGRYRIKDEEYDVVVSTIAPDLMKKIVPELKIPEVSYRAAICPLFWLRSQPTSYYWINILDMQIPFSVIINQQSLLPSGYYQGYHPLYVGHYVSGTSGLLQQSDEQLFGYYLSHLQKIFPGIEKEVEGYEIGRAKYAQPIVTVPWTPLQHTTNIPNLYTTSMAHIFPEDRGVNYSIREAERITRLLTENET